MSRDAAPPEEPVSSTHIAEAAAWVAHLHGSRRTADSDRGLKLWLKEDPARARVWEAAAEVWDEVGNLQGAAIAQALKKQRRAEVESRVRWKPLALAACLVVAVGAFFLLSDGGVETGIGEQRTLALEDGTRVFLNTATRLVVRYDGRQRHVELRSGEALFEVAKHPDRPFIVSAAGREVTALGTAFVVRRDSEQVSVTLVEGKVSVAPEDPRGQSTAKTHAAILSPGERLTFASSRQAPRLDHPELNKLTAWQRGQVVLDGLRLQDAIAEMNRYSTTRLALEMPQAADVRVSGVFRSGDSMSFARAVAATYRFEVIERKGRILIAGLPAAAYRFPK